MIFWEGLEEKRFAVKFCDSYLPFGGTFNSYTSGTENLYKFNGKEKQDETGWYDYGLRFYDPELMMWHAVDPSAERYYEWSPYNYVFNNPIRLIDPDGADPEDVLRTATAYVGTNYEYGGKNPDPRGIGIKNRVSAGMASIHTQVSKDLGALAASQQWGAINSYYQTLGVQSGCSFGIDCSGLVATAFNADPDKLMGDLAMGNANSQMAAFSEADQAGTGTLHNDLNLLGKGDVVFNTNSEGTAKHTMIATGEVKTDKNGNVKKFQTVEATQSGDKVRTKWRSVKSHQKIGHTFRSTDTNQPGPTRNGTDKIKQTDFVDQHQNIAN